MLDISNQFDYTVFTLTLTETGKDMDKYAVIKDVGTKKEIILIQGTLRECKSFISSTYNNNTEYTIMDSLNMVIKKWVYCTFANDLVLMDI